MSTLLLALSAANRKLSVALAEIAKPVKDAPGVVTSTIAVSGFAAGFQPLMVPSRVAKMKIAGEPLFSSPVEPLATMPVGWPGPLPPAVGIETLSGTLDPLAS